MKKILVIEDNLDMRENIQEMLELASYNVLAAENGKIGVELAKNELPDLIVCDVMMPELDGYGVLYMLGRNAETATIPFIFLTAKSEKDDFRKGMSLGADDYLTKPFEEMELLSAIEGRLKKSEMLKVDKHVNIDGLNNFISQAKTLIELSESKKSRNYKNKSILFHEGDLPQGLYFLNKGKVKTYKTNEDGKEYVTGLYNERDFFGYISLMKDVAYNETAMALEDVDVVVIPKQDFLNLIYFNREISQQFIKLLANHILEKEQSLIDLAYNTVRKRVADALIVLRDKYQKTGSKTFSFTLSRDDLASMAGTARETVIRILSEFKDENIISTQGKEITVLDADKLQNIRY